MSERPLLTATAFKARANPQQLEAIEDFHKSVLRGEAYTLSEQQIINWFDTNYVYLTKRERVYLASYIRQVALNQILRYYRRYQHDWSHIRDARA